MVAWGVLFIFHQPAFMCCRILSNNCCCRESRHLGRWYGYSLPSSISGILWFTSHKGSSSSGAPLNMSLYFWNHCSLSWGMSSSVRGLAFWMSVSLLVFVEVVSSGMSFGVLFLLQFSLLFPSVLTSASWQIFWWSEKIWLCENDWLMYWLSDDLNIWKKLILELLRIYQIFQNIRESEHQIIRNSQTTIPPVSHIVQSDTLAKVGQWTCTNACKDGSSLCQPTAADMVQPWRHRFCGSGQDKCYIIN